MAKTWIVLAGILGATGVAVGAFGAHSLPGLLSHWQLEEQEVAKRLDTFEKGVRYQMYHVLALLVVGLLALHRTGPALTTAGVSYVAGILIFSGLLYAIVLTGVKPLGAIVPLGGMAFIVGWIALAVAGWQFTR
jgi:uncharacterized membrane protein YgdD (TMEM256/DUF423 family)